jgi:hypothetical protein
MGSSRRSFSADGLPLAVRRLARAGEVDFEHGGGVAADNGGALMFGSQIGRPRSIGLCHFFAEGSLYVRSAAAYAIH